MKTLYSRLLLMAMLLICGCTQNNGYIGPIFGSWSLVEITSDGIPVDMDDETVFSFQNEVVRVVRLVDAPLYTMSRYGNFTLEDGMLELRFQPKPTPSDGRQYMAPDWLGFPEGENIIHFHVERLSGSEMRLLLESGGGGKIYSFKKTW